MPDKSALIKAAILSLLPPGVIWTPAMNEDLDKLLEAMSENWLDAYNAAFELGDIRNPFKTQLLQELEREFGFLENSDLSEEVRRQQLAAVKFENTDQRNSDGDVQALLNAAGFAVQVHHNDPAVDPALFPGDIFLSDGKYIMEAAYLMQCGGASAFCGHQKAVCGYFESFDFIDFEHILPTDPELWPFIYFIGGAAVRDGGGFLTSIAPADVPLNRKDKFIELVLSSKPWFDWVILIINYV